MSCTLWLFVVHFAFYTVIVPIQILRNGTLEWGLSIRESVGASIRAWISETTHSTNLKLYRRYLNLRLLILEKFKIQDRAPGGGGGGLYVFLHHVLSCLYKHRLYSSTEDRNKSVFFFFFQIFYWDIVTKYIAFDVKLQEDMSYNTNWMKSVNLPVVY